MVQYVVEETEGWWNASVIFGIYFWDTRYRCSTASGEIQEEIFTSKTFNFNDVDTFYDIYGNNDSYSADNMYHASKICKMAVLLRKFQKIWSDTAMEIFITVSLHS